MNERSFICAKCRSCQENTHYRDMKKHRSAVRACPRQFIAVKNHALVA